jgi:hypothetical protein
LLPKLCSHFTLEGAETLPTQTLLLIDSLLYDFYPPLPEVLSASFQCLRLIRDVIKSTSASLLVPLLVALSRSLCQWIEDRSEVLLDTEYNSEVRVLFCFAFSPFTPRRYR